MQTQQTTKLISKLNKTAQDAIDASIVSEKAEQYNSASYNQGFAKGIKYAIALLEKEGGHGSE